jgi:Protein of unknown function (DUF2946)
MFARRIRQRSLAWVAMVALVGGMLSSPFAHALASRIGGAGSDLCSVMSPAAKPMAPGGLGHAAHVGDCPCCTASTPGIATAFAPALALRADATPQIAAPLRFEVIQKPFAARVGLARAPPLFS